MRTRRLAPYPRALGATLALAGALLAAGLPRPAAAQPAGMLVQGSPPPEFALLDTTGKVVQLSDFRGRAILLSFWSCYTDTCFAATQAYSDLLDRLGPRGLAAPTICSELPPALAADGYAGLLKRCNAGQTILIDPEQRVSTFYGVKEYPTTVLIGPEFTVREVLAGVAALRDPAFHQRLENVVAEAAAWAPAK